MSLMKKALTLVVGDQSRIKRPLKGRTERDLIRLESKIGRELFGPVPHGNRREFFCLDEHTWIWHEEWTDAATGKPAQLTTRYEIHENGILKVQDGRPYTFVEGQELEYLTLAIKLYSERVAKEVYRLDPSTGQRLSASVL